MPWHDIEQNTDEWLDRRLGMATASKFHLFMANDGFPFGEPAKRYALELALERKTGRRSVYSFSNAHTERGHEMEPAAIALYEEERFCTVKNGGFFDCGEYGDSPDGLIGDDGVLEIKSVIAPVHHATYLRGRFDPAHRWQLMGHLYCSGRAWVDFGSYCPDYVDSHKLIVYRLHREEHLSEMERLHARLQDFLKLVWETADSLPA